MIQTSSALLEQLLMYLTDKCVSTQFLNSLDTPKKYAVKTDELRVQTFTMKKNGETPNIDTVNFMFE